MAELSKSSNLSCSQDVPAQEAVRARNLAFWRTLASSYGLRIITVATNLVSVPLAARHLGAERYGLWLTMGSFISVLTLCEFGLGNNLTTLIAQARGRGDSEACSRHVSATFWLVLALALAMFAAFALVHPLIDWPSIFNVSDAVTVTEAPPAALLIGLIAATQLVAGLCNRIYAGLQQGYRSSMWQALSILAGLLALIVASNAKGGLVSLSVALGLVPAVVQLIGLAWALRFAAYGRLLGPRCLNRNDFRTVLEGSMLMFLVNLQAFFWLSKDNILIAHALELAEVGRYNTAWRIYMALFGVLAGAVGASLWPAYTDAFTRGDREWIRGAIHRSLVTGTTIMILFSILFVTIGEWFLTWYVGAPLAASRSTLASLGVYFICLTAVNLIGTPLMGIGRIGTIAWGGLAGGLAALPLGWLALDRWGISGLIGINIVCCVTSQLIPLMLVLRRAVL